MNNNSLKITVVTVSYNAAATIEETILSVVDQTYDNIEYIVIDGGSTDGTVDIIKRYAEGGSEYSKHNNSISYWVSEPDKGIYDAMNKGIKISTGDYLNFMNSGDCFFNSTTINDVVLAGLNIYDIVYGDTIFVYQNMKLYVKPRPLTAFYDADPIYHQSSFTRTTLLKKDSFDTSFKIAADYDFFFKQYIRGAIFKYLDIPISFFDAEDGISSNRVMLRMKENLRVTNQIKNIRYYLITYKAWSKLQLKLILSKIAPKVSQKIRFWNLTRNPRITILKD